LPGASALFVAVYCPAAFNPTNIATDYFADPGFSASVGSTATFSFSMAAGAICLFIVSEVDAGSCGDVGCAYTLNWTMAPVAATFRSLSAVSTTRGTLVRWRTASEVDALGFNVYRSVHGRRVRVNAHLIPSHGAGAYSFLDRLAPRAKSLRYWVQLVNVDGSRRWYGPARVARP